MDDPQDLISVYEAANPTEAHLVMNLLLDEEIDARVSEENDPLEGLPLAAPDVLVRRMDKARARQIIGEYQQEQLDRANRPDWICPKCGVTVIGAFDECDNCGTDHP